MILLPHIYPLSPPVVFLDEPINQDVIEMIDYLENENRVLFEYLLLWGKAEHISNNRYKWNLSTLYAKLSEIFTKMPPISLSELFDE